MCNVKNKTSYNKNNGTHSKTKHDIRKNADTPKTIVPTAKHDIRKTNRRTRKLRFSMRRMEENSAIMGTYPYELYHQVCIDY